MDGDFFPSTTRSSLPQHASTTFSDSLKSEDSDDESVECDESIDSEPDITLINELIEYIERNPPALEARKLLMEQYADCGWLNAANETAQEILKTDPADAGAKNCVAVFVANSKRRGLGKGKGKERITNSKCKGKARGIGKGKQREGKIEHPERRSECPTWRPSLFAVSSLATTEQELKEGYLKLLARAKKLHSEMKDLRQLKGMRDLGCEEHVPDVAALAQGTLSSIVRVKPPESVSIVSRAIVAEGGDNHDKCLDIALQDLEDFTRWLKKTDGEVFGKSKRAASIDSIRETLMKRVRGLQSLLPKELQPLADEAMMHLEHELLQREYVNGDSTMYGDAVSDIPRTNFWTSEDGYAWGMDELAQAITSNGGVMRNPLSKQIFTVADIQAIVQHPLGKQLAALQVEQSKLKLGVRAKTIDELERLAKVLLVDMSEDQMPSRTAVEHFVAYLATLPDAEQKAVDGLKVPANDSHTGMEFDTVIGDAVRDAQANKVCFHKTGDLLSQAAKHLRK